MPLPFFDARRLPPAQNEFVAWLDVMGIQSKMAYSIPVTANFVFKLHIAALQSARPTISLYPVMDGIYATSPDPRDLGIFLSNIFAALTDLFAETSQPHFRFIIKSAISYGEVYHGAHVEAGASEVLARNPDYRSSIVLGLPIVHAHLAEKEAPPFGVSIHDSAIQEWPGDRHPARADWWLWWPPYNYHPNFFRVLSEHYDWCEKYREYPLERILVHRGLAERYFV